MAIEEVGGGVISGQPVAIQKKIVDIVGENQLFERYAARAQPGDEIDGLREIDIAIVVAVDEEHGRLPGVDRSDRGRVVGELGELGRNILAVPIVGGPIVDAVKIDTGGKNVGVAAEAEGGEVSPVASTPEANAG